MFGGLDQVFGLKINFNTKKVDSGYYGYECWKVFWSSFDMEIFENMMSPPLDILSGDADNETFSICIEALAMRPEYKDLLDDLANNLLNNKSFTDIAHENGIEKYSNSMLFNSFSPFIKTLKIKWGKIQTDNEDIAHTALETLKLYRAK